MIGEDPQKACGETILNTATDIQTIPKIPSPDVRLTTSLHRVLYCEAGQCSSYNTRRIPYQFPSCVANRSEWTRKSNLRAKSRSTSNSKKGRAITRFKWQETEKNHKKGRDG